MQENINIRKFKIKDFKSVINIYKKSFPKEEQFPLSLLYFNILRKNANLFVLENNHKILGFTYLIYYKNMIFILYLAIDSTQRNNGYGSTLLKWSLDTYKDKIIYLNIDEVNSNFNDYEFRKKRLYFYLANNFYLTEYLSIEKSGNFNILSNNKIFNITEYTELDSKIAQWLFDDKSEIKKY